MTLVKWEPFRELTDMHRSMDRLFGDRYLRQDDDGLFAGFSPTVDVYDNETEIVIEAEVSGINEKDIAVEVKDNVLTLSGERKREQEVKEGSYHRSERSFGKFQRSFTLPDSIEVDKVNAKNRNGVLTIRLPKAPQGGGQEDRRSRGISGLKNGAGESLGSGRRSAPLPARVPIRSRRFIGLDERVGSSNLETNGKTPRNLSSRSFSQGLNRCLRKAKWRWPPHDQRAAADHLQRHFLL